MSTKSLSPLNQYAAAMTCSNDTQQQQQQQQQQKKKSRRRLKESCSECAIAKVKCSKDKPTCSRCQDRGLSCGYGISHRAGRRPAQGSSKSSTQRSSATPRANNEQPVDVLEAASSALLDFSSTASLADNHAGMDYFLNDTKFESSFIDLDHTLLSPTMLHNISQDIPMADFDHGILSTYQNPVRDERRLFHEPSNTMPDCMALPFGPTSTRPTQPLISSSRSQSPFGSRTGSSTSLSDYQTKYYEPMMPFHCGTKNGCVSQILSMLAVQNSTEIGFTSLDEFMMPRILGAKSSDKTVMNARDTIDRNKAILDVAGGILACQCLSSNDQLIPLLFFTAMDVMARYAAAALYPDFMSTEQIMDGNVQHMTDDAQARLVFGELHRPLRFIDAFGKRLHTRLRSNLQERDSPTNNVGTFQFPVGGNGSEFTNGMNGQDGISDRTWLALEGDLRKRFERIKDDIANSLKAAS